MTGVQTCALPILLPVRLQDDLVDLGPDVDVVDVSGSEVRLQRAEDAGERHAEHLRLAPVDVQSQVGRVGRVAAEGIEEF